MSILRKLACWLVAGVFVQVFTSVVVLGENAAPARENVGSEICSQCHEGYMSKTVHGRLNAKTPGLEAISCEACHGPGSEHVGNGGDKSMITRIPAPRKVKDNCLTCHPQQRDVTAKWKRDPHFSHTELDCLACHSIHDSKNFSQLKQKEPELCFSCHKQTQMDFARPYHHPVGEGEVTCSSCHTPHVGKRDVGPMAEKNEVCLKCHFDVKGPFMWEHKAVTSDDGCINCHQPHGGSFRKLLTQGDNQLCLKCHQDLLTLPFNIAGSGGKSRVTLEHARLPMLQGKCTNCHGTTFSPVVGAHTDKVTAAECALCHTDIKKVDHTRYLAEGSCLDCHTDIHGSNHSRTFRD